MLRYLLYRSALLPITMTVALLLLTLILLLNKSSSGMKRLETIVEHSVELKALQDIGLELQVALVESLNESNVVGPSYMRLLNDRLQGIAAAGNHLAAATSDHLKRALTIIADAERPAQLALIDVLAELRQAIIGESAAHDELLRQIQDDNRTEFWVSTAVMVIFPVLTLGGLYYLHRRIWLPLTNLGELMTRLAQPDYGAIALDKVEPLLKPLFDHYNAMVSRLAELEQQHRSRQQTLEDEVRLATGTLLEYQRDLANAERLAAVGEITAKLAHELRNPLAGMEMALSNLSRSLTDPGQGERLRAVINELGRITKLLNQSLAESRHSPEPMIEVDVAGSVDAVLTLARYQVPQAIQLKSAVPAHIVCRWPDGEFRQALWNLITNAAQSIGNRTGFIAIDAHRQGHLILLSVTDDGPGLPTDLLRDGVRPFVTRREQGTGLGLAMVQRFVRHLGGTLRFANRDPCGATVTLEIPCGVPHD